MDNVERLEIHENVVSTDYIERLNGGDKWKLVYYTYATEWTDKEHVVYGETLEDVLKHYPECRLKDKLADDDEWTTEYLIENYEWGL